MAVRVLRACAVMIVAGAIGYAVAPLHTSGWRLDGTPRAVDAGTSASTACAVAPTDAWRARPQAGWFGYAPLTSVPLVAVADCRSAARRRLSQSAAVLLLGVFVALLAYASASVRLARRD